MEKFVLLTDVNCDLGEDLRKEYEIEYFNAHYTAPDGVDRLTYLDYHEMTKQEFFLALKKNPKGYTTAPANVAECYNAFEKYVKEGNALIVFALSSGLSGTYDFMKQAEKMILERYKNAKIHILDTLRFGAGYGVMEIKASEMRKEGKSFEEVVDYLETNKNRYHQMGWLDDLTFVARKGRLNNAAAFFGTLVGIKPLGEFDYNGMTTVLGKCKGEKQAYDVILKYIEATIENPEEQVILIETALRDKQAQELKRMIEEKFHPKKIYINDVCISCGVNVGPGLMAAYYYGKPISIDLKEEKELVNRLITG